MKTGAWRPQSVEVTGSDATEHAHTKPNKKLRTRRKIRDGLAHPFYLTLSCPDSKYLTQLRVVELAAEHSRIVSCLITLLLHHDHPIQHTFHYSQRNLEQGYETLNGRRARQRISMNKVGQMGAAGLQVTVPLHGRSYHSGNSTTQVCSLLWPDVLQETPFLCEMSWLVNEAN